MARNNDFRIEQWFSNQKNIINFTGYDKHVVEAEKFGFKLLVVGFILLGFGGLANGLSFILESDQKKIEQERIDLLVADSIKHLAIETKQENRVGGRF